MGMLIQFPPYTEATETEAEELQRLYEVMWLNGLEWRMLKACLDYYHRRTMDRIGAIAAHKKSP